MIKRITILSIVIVNLYIGNASGSEKGNNDPLVFTNYSYASLIEYLQKDSTLKEYDKVKAIWDWIYANISYDLKSFEKGKIIPSNPEYTLAHRKAVCAGYSELFNYFAKNAGLQSFYIPGYAKDHEFYLENSFLRTNHAWNAVRIDGIWYLLDATLGGGTIEQKEGGFNQIISKIVPLATIKNKYIYIKQQDNSWFLMHPDSFILTHLPSDPVWQLLDNIVPLSVFISSKDTLNKYLDSCKIYACDTLVFRDSINQLVHYTEAQQTFISGQRAYTYNPENYQIIGNAYTKKSIYEWNSWLGKTNKTNQEKLTDLNTIIEGFNQTKNYYMLEKAQIRSEHNLLTKKNKNLNKFIVKSCTAYINKNNSIIEKNKNNIKKGAEIKRDYSARINQLKKQNNNILFDDKIYTISRSKTEPTPDVTAQIVSYFKLINKNEAAIDSIKNELKIDFDQQFAAQESYYKNTASMLILLTDSNITCIRRSIALLNQNNPFFIDEINKLQVLVSANRDTLASLQKEILESGKSLLKEGSKELKIKHAEIFSLIKENKNMLKGIKKLSIINRDEEALYDLENEKLIIENKELIARYDATCRQVIENKNFILVENKILKNESKHYKNLIKYENLRFSSESKHEMVRYKYYSEVNKIELKKCAQFIAVVNKAAKALQTISTTQSK